MKRLWIPLAALALAIAACGGTEAEGDDDSAALPPAAGTCLEGTQDCNDTPGTAPDDLFYGDEPTGEETDDEAVDGSLLPAGEGLSVPEALTTNATGVIAVTGFYFDDGSGARLCELLAESYPAQCAGAVLPLAESDIDPESLDTAQGVTWSPSPITVLGEIVDGVLQPTPTSI